MRKRAFHLITAAFAVSLTALGCFSSGGSYGKVNVATDKLGGIKKIALLQNMIEKAGVAGMSGLNPGSSDANFAAISGDLNKVAAGVVDGYRDAMAKKIADELKVTVISGKQIAKAYQTAEKDGFGIFPVDAYADQFAVVQASGEKNFLNAPGGEFGPYLEATDLGKLAAYFCEKLQVDAVAFATTKVVYVKVSGENASLMSGLAVYDRSGTRVILGAVILDPPLEVVSAKDVAGFTKLMQKYVYVRTLDRLFARVNEQRGK